LHYASIIFAFFPALCYIGVMKKTKEMPCCRSVCPIANALDILGDRWTLLVIRDMMMFNKHEYHEFLAGSEKIATNILSDRLKRLLCLDVIRFKSHPDHKTKKLYYLTQKGKDLLPILVELVLWGSEYHGSPEMPREGLNHLKRMKREPRKFMRGVLQGLSTWEKRNLNQK